MLNKIIEVLTMPETTNAMVVVAMIVAFLAFVAFVFKEKSLDERESVHILKASRISYLVGVGVLVFALVIQTFMHSIDIWIVYAIIAMVVSKLATRIYSHYKM